ncbi:MAG: hypothetical protein ACSW8J_02330 [bacterium]
MRIDENRTIAWAVLALCVVLSVFVMGGGALGRERGKALKVFNDGANTKLSTRHSMDAYLDAAGEFAVIMAREAENLGESELGRQTRADAALVGQDAADLTIRSRAYTDLKDEVNQLYNKLYDSVGENFKHAYDDFWGQDDMLKRDEYHKLAKDYNALASGFPAGLVASITRQGALDTFGG